MTKAEGTEAMDVEEKFEEHMNDESEFEKIELCEECEIRQRIFLSADGVWMCRRCGSSV